MLASENRFREITEKLTQIPTLPTVVTKITLLMQNPRTSASEVGQAITTDQSLTTKTLKLVNSAFYGFPGRINTITHAIVILGFSTVKNIVLTASILDSLGGKKNKAALQFDVEAFWKHSVGSGAIAKVLADTLLPGSREEAFIAGLLHDLGKVVLSTFASEDYKAVLDYRDRENVLLREAERKVLGFTHSEVGLWLAEKWSLPRDLRAVVEYHHNPGLANPYEKLTSIVHLADILSRALGANGGDDCIPQISDYVWEKLHLESMNWPDLLKKCEIEIDKASVFLEEL